MVALAVGMVWPVWALTGKAQELVRQADQLQAASDPASDESSQRAITLYQEAAGLEPNSAEIQVKLADAALTVAAWTSGDRLRWYQLGRAAAERAVVLDQNDAEAVFLLAAHRGQIASLQKDLGGLLVPQELERLLSRALVLNPRHARALHMMGVLLERTPAPLRLSPKEAPAMPRSISLPRSSRTRTPPKRAWIWRGTTRAAGRLRKRARRFRPCCR